MAYVLATDIEDVDPETGMVRLLAKRGDSLPASLKDSKDDYVRDGILVDERFLPEGATSMTYTEMEHTLAVAGADLTDEQLKAVQDAFEERRSSFSGTDDETRRSFAHDVSRNLAQVHADRTSASPAIHRAAPAQRVGKKSE